MPKKIGILTSGGDCPGLNAVIRAIVRKSVVDYEAEVVGILRGWRGLMDGLFLPLTQETVSGILPRGGTILRTSRTNPLAHQDGVANLLQNLKKSGIEAVIAIGGDEEVTFAHELHAKHGVGVVCVPKTIDNNVFGTDYTFGFDTTVNIAMEAIDRIHTTAESHDRVMVVEVMGRESGWIALYAGLAGGADIILIPEQTLSVYEVAEQIRSRHDRGKDFSIVVVAEGARLKLDDGTVLEETIGKERDEFDHPRYGGIGHRLAHELERETGFETRVTVLGHIQRGGTPSAFDRVLGTRYGVAAAQFAQDGRVGTMVALQGDRIVALPLAESAGKIRNVPPELYELAKPFSG